MNRPKCRRCGGPLDLWHDVETGQIRYHCNNPWPIDTDQKFWNRWIGLTNDERITLCSDADVSWLEK